MAFVLPTFNLPVSIWRTGWAANNYATPDVSAMANLSPGQPVTMTQSAGVNSAGPKYLMVLRLPKLTDIRPSYVANNSEDLVEVPAGSKRFYSVQMVDDIGKGFTNEHRLALIMYTPNQTFADTGLIAPPVPLP